MAIFINQIIIDKLRHLENIIIDTSDTNNKKNIIITGKNGVGKTTLLESIKQFLKSLEDNIYYGITFEYKNSIEYLKKRIDEIENGINVKADNPLEKSRCIESMKNLQSAIDKYEKGIKVKFNDDTDLINKFKNGDFILAYFKARRDSKVIVPEVVSTVELENNYSIEADIDTKFLDYLVYLKTQQSFARNEDDMETVEAIGKWFDKFQDSLRNIFDDESLLLKFDYRKLNFKIQQQGREEYGLNELSDGFSAVLDIVMNLILRMEKTRKGFAYDKEGIVLIDEVETHLHIELQKKILPFLTGFFPNIQFIVTTHSPFVLNSIEDVVIYDLEKQIKVEDLSSSSYEGIVEGYFNVDQYSNEAKKKLYRYEELVEKIGKTEEEESEEFDLRQYFKGIPESLASEIVFEFKKIELSRLRSK
ncbi:AAA family ATPase [Clostridium culturomicium]|uniref:AAA family ATPase n=1 Tax=Clostridium culturomicium TaxID=1499683 RepID=UPI003857B980